MKNAIRMGTNVCSKLPWKISTHVTFNFSRKSMFSSYKCELRAAHFKTVTCSSNIREEISDLPGKKLPKLPIVTNSYQ